MRRLVRAHIEPVGAGGVDEAFDGGGEDGVAKETPRRRTLVLVPVLHLPVLPLVVVVSHR